MLFEGMLTLVLMTPGLLPQVHVQAIEVTQAIQDTANSVPLIANRRTVVRVYLNADTGWVVRGWLRVTSACGVTRIRSMNYLTIDTAMNGNLALKRSTIHGSLNFVIPACEGKTTLTLDTVKHDRERLTVDSPSLSVTFDTATSLPLCIVTIPYKLKNGSVLMPRPVDYRLLRSWLLRAFPISELSIRHGYADTVYEDPKRCIDPVTCSWNSVTSFARVDRELQGDNRTHYYGIIFSDSTSVVRGMTLFRRGQHPPVSIGPTGIPFGKYQWDTDSSFGDWYAAHEIGHQFYRYHIRCGRGNADGPNIDPLYPYYGGFLSDTSHTYVGFDVGDPVNAPEIPMRPLRWDTHHDIMSYSIDLWPSEYTYCAILKRLRFEAMKAMRPDAGNSVVSSNVSVQKRYLQSTSSDAISIVGTVDTAAGTGQIADVTHLKVTNSTELSSSAPGSRLTLRLLDAAGRILKEHGVEVGYVSIECEESDCPNVAYGSIDELLPDINGIVVIQLLLDNRVVDSWQVPQISRSHDGSAKISKTPTGVVVRWPNLPKCSNNRNYLVQESLDGGQTWFLLAIERGSPGIVLDRASYTGVNSIVLRVIEDAGADSKEVVRTRVSL